MDNAIRAPLSERVNLRFLATAGLLAALVLALAGWIVYTVVFYEVTGGIVDRGEYVQVDLKAMSNFPFDQVNGTAADIPEIYRNLDGKRVQVVGEMWAPYAAGNYVNDFELVYSIAKCCFSGPPQIQHFVKSTAADGQPMPYYSGLVQITGKLRVDVTKAEGKVASVYRLDVEEIRPI